MIDPEASLKDCRALLKAQAEEEDARKALSEKIKAREEAHARMLTHLTADKKVGRPKGAAA